MNKIITSIDTIGSTRCLCSKDAECYCTMPLCEDGSDQHPQEISADEVPEMLMDWRKEVSTSDPPVLPPHKLYVNPLPPPMEPVATGKEHINQMYVKALPDPLWRVIGTCKDCDFP